MALAVAVHNLGCKVNNYELDLMVQELKQAGCEIVSFEEKADVYIVNTCTVTSIADRKSRQMLHRAKHVNPHALVIAAGCYVETDQETLKKDPLVDLCLGNQEKKNILSILKGTEIWKEKQGSNQDVKSDKNEKGNQREEGKETKEPKESKEPKEQKETQRLSHSNRTRADVKIQDGCNQFCSYCIIPYARGRIRSRDQEEILEEVKGLAATGVKEVVLTGIHVSSYGKDKGLEPEQEFLSLLQKLQLVSGICRIRFSSLEPRIITPSFVQGIHSLSKVCPHFHLSLQSGCDATLQRMNRHYTTEEYLKCVKLLREVYEDPAITTDVIVGFPGETQEEFQKTREFLEQVKFYEIHVFRYSKRKGTVAATLPNPCTDAQKEERSRILLTLTHAQAHEFRESFLGKKEEILLEKKVVHQGMVGWVGHTMRYVEGFIPEEKLLSLSRDNHDNGYSRQQQLVKGVFTSYQEDTKCLEMQPQSISS